MKPGTAFPKRGELYWANLDPVKGSEQSGRRPVVVIQNNIGNEYSSTTIVAALTTRVFTKEYPTNVMLPKGSVGLKTDSTVLLNQVRTIDKKRLEARIGILDREQIAKIDRAVKISLGLG